MGWLRLSLAEAETEKTPILARVSIVIVMFSVWILVDKNNLFLSK